MPGTGASRSRSPITRTVCARLGALLAALALVALLGAGQARAEGITNSGSDLRDGWYPQEGSLSAATVSGGAFGKLWSSEVTGQVYAQPLLDGHMLLVATQEDNVYGLDAVTGKRIWARNLGESWNPEDLKAIPPCEDIKPRVGVTATPVIDAATGTAYLTYKTYIKEGANKIAAWFMDAIEVSSGAVKPGFPVKLSGNAQNQPGLAFEAKQELQRPGLLLMNGVVYAAFGAHCDTTPWQGWVFGVSTQGAIRARWVDEKEGTGGGIWQSGTGLASDGPGTILLSTGNGNGTASGGEERHAAPGNSPPPSLGNSVVRLRVEADGSLRAVNFFTPFDAKELDELDKDFASGGVTVLRDELFGTSAFPHLALAIGKVGNLYLLNRDELGGYLQGSGGTDNVVQELPTGDGGIWSRPAVWWDGTEGWAYFPTAPEEAPGHLHAYRYSVNGEGRPSLSSAGSSEGTFGFGSGAGVITSQGTAAGSAVVWTIYMAGGTGEGSELRGYLPVPENGTLREIWHEAIGIGTKFSTPGVGLGHLFVGTRDGHVLAFGAPFATASGEFPATTVGSTSARTLTLTANRQLRLTRLVSSSPLFTLGSPSRPLPAELASGQTIEVPVTFAPAQAGPQTATLTAETNLGPEQFRLSGSGQEPPPPEPTQQGGSNTSGSGSSTSQGSGGVLGAQISQLPAGTSVVVLASVRAAVSRSGALKVRIHCTSATAPCSGTITLRTLSLVRGAGHSKRILTLAHAHFSIAPSGAVTVTLKLTHAARALLAGRRSLRVRAVLSGQAGTSTSALITLVVARH